MTVRVLRPADHVAELVMDRPEALNAISTEQARRISEACVSIGADPSISVVILSSALARAFCAGADLKERAGFSADDLRQQRPVLEAAFGDIANLAVPSIAAVDGVALGGGCELALSCDLIVASEQASFGLPEVGLGLIPGGGGTQLLPRRVGLNRAADLIFTGRRVEASEALQLGLVDRLVPPGEAKVAALQLAMVIAAKSPVSLRAAKRALRSAADLDLASGLRIEAQAWEDAAFSADRVEGIDAFLARRPPRWPGWETDPP
jgi:enoyl-CoA hydratase/carnithine racemase